ncbi:MAG: hypothetical protein JRH18_19610 [Deltaproteobacteria bacterium]|nr:hypothetical protein [Deltaproteobacteria bacterium]
MVKQLSYTKFEHEILPEFRQKLNKAESTEDVKKFFIQTLRILFEKIFEKKITFSYEDIWLVFNEEPYFTINPRLLASEDFKSVWNESDLPNVLNRLAKSAIKRYKRLERHPEKTSSKIRM